MIKSTVFWMKDPKKVVKEDEKTKSISYPAFFRKYHQITLVLAALVLIYFCHMLVNTYMINVLENIGGNTADQGNAIFIQAMCELPPMFLFALILKKVDVDKLMAFGALAYIVKHALLCFAPNMAVFYIAMVLQMFSYAVIMPASVYFADKHVEVGERGAYWTETYWTKRQGYKFAYSMEMKDNTCWYGVGDQTFKGLSVRAIWR